MAAMFGEDHLRPNTRQPRGDRTVKERGVLMRVKDVNAPRPDLPGQPPGDTQVQSGPAAEGDDWNALLQHPLSELANSVEAEHDRRDSRAQTPNRLGDEHFGAGDGHHVQHEPDVNGSMATAVHGVARQCCVEWPAW